MTYNINKTNGDLLSSIPDGTFDSSTTDITLIGKNVTSFGEAINENFVKLLENFSSPTAPNNPIKGQLWYDTSTGRLNIYTGTAFRTASGPLISATIPTNIVSGDIWINSLSNQVYFYDGTDWILAGPIYSNQQGLTGFKVETVVDTYNQDRTVCLLYVGNSLLGIFSKIEFTLKNSITGYTGSVIKVGFNSSGVAGFKFHATATTAEQILDENGNAKSASEIAFLNTENTFGEIVTFESDVSLAGVASLKVTNSNLVIEQQTSNKDIIIKSKADSVTNDAIVVKGQTSRVGIFNSSPQASLDVSGDVIISGNLVVNGSTTTVTSNDLEVIDKNIVLGSVETPTDQLADGGGITLNGSTDKTITWSFDINSWVSSENINIDSGKSYKINGNDVLTSTTLGSSVTNSSLTSVGTLVSLDVDNINIIDNEISSTNVNGDISLNPNGNGRVNVNSAAIVNVKNPEALTDASNKFYVDTTIFSRSLAMSMDISGLTTNAQIAQILGRIAPFYVPNGTVEQQSGVAIDGTLLRLHCSKITVSTEAVSAPTLNYTRVTVDKDNNVSSQSVVADVTANSIPGPVANVVVIRQDKEFIMGGSPSGPGTGVSGEWGFYRDVGQAYTSPFTSLGYVLP